MNIIKIRGAEKAMSAGEWCNQEFGHDGWNLNLDHLLTGRPEYQFEFTDSSNATLFALRWA